MRRHKKKLKKMSNAFCFKVGFLLYLYDSTKTTTYSVTMVQCKGRQTTWAEVAPEKICGEPKSYQYGVEKKRDVGEIINKMEKDAKCPFIKEEIKLINKTMRK